MRHILQEHSMRMQFVQVAMLQMCAAVNHITITHASA